METLSTSSTFITTISNHTHFKTFISTSKVPVFTIKANRKTLFLSTSQPPHTFSIFSSANTTPTSTPSKSTTFTSIDTDNHHWMVLMEKPPRGVNSKREIIDYYVKTLESLLGSVKDAQMCIYDVSTDTHFGFCCDIDEETSVELAGVPGILSVRPDPDYNSSKKDYGSSVALSNSWNSQYGNLLLFPTGNTKHWLVKIDKPGVGVVTKAQMVDYYTRLLVKVMGNQQDAEMCIYHVSWQSNFGFCCELDEECARELAGVPGVLSVQPDNNFESENKDYGGSNVQNSMDTLYSSQASSLTPIKTKKLFITGLSFYTSEKTLRAAFEGFGELVEVKIIMDKISKRSKGYAFVEYTTEEAASAALKEMNGKIINGWMIVVDVARSSPPKNGRGRPRP